MTNLSCILANQSDEQKCKMFPYLLKATARRWFHGLHGETKWDWLRLKDAFLDKFDQKADVQQLLEALQMHQQEDLQSYETYEGSFLHSLSCLDQSLEEKERPPNMLVKQILIDGLFWPLQKKVICREPNTFKEVNHKLHCE